ncbi:hypothetical protein KN246_14745 [Mycobacterium intracellulare]|uniref:hypothetical protein n=1 Tax=Mycobacterium intracellulare TaxID=1767 RepID=UPI0001B4586A|nr:hypothetical protein [Mycobacterium intracellulare]OBG17183.1 hypothetical protein A5769_15120 [Mycobacterium intracellulare]UGT99327.1 hypothetical protein LTQ55_12665 [Mycobacterium intracellulare]UGU08770.1 hypothetical protein LTQ56_09115 [Mycobacterium intracellulare subsp. intracellulare]UQB95543.1 hypothetical protein KN246_14745 [Mycobacterium intracellulare]BCO57896.1 hypothetical protein MINTM005_31400 [Mycobacterium intracellulare]
MNWKSMAALLAGIPDLPGARCKGRADLFEATIAEHTKRASRAELELARTTALRTCADCPALDRCRRWFGALPLARRPRGVVAGLVIGSTGLPSKTGAPADDR